MQVKLQKWGNSNAVRIPATILNELNLKENDILELKQEDDKIIISKTKHKSIKELFESYQGDYVCEEYEPYDVKGNELW